MRRKTKHKSKVKELICTNCKQPISAEENQNNKGYCNECAFEAWGEGEPPI